MGKRKKKQKKIAAVRGKVGEVANVDFGVTYFDPTKVGSFGGVRALSRATGTKRSDAKRWLDSLVSYTVHKPIRKKFARRRVIVRGINSQWEADLVDMQAISKANDGHRFILTCIDVFSKYAYAVALKDKRATSVTTAFRTILTEGSPQSLHTDEGVEFLNGTFQRMLKSEGIRFFTTFNTAIKASVVERFNRTIKSRLWRYFTHRGSYRWLDDLQSFLSSYNRSPHRSIGMAPAAVTEKNSSLVRTRLYGKVAAVEKRRLNVGDDVRLTKARNLFAKSFWANWSEEAFKVSRVLDTRPTTYRVVDSRGEEILGTFYADELQKIRLPEFFRVESILSTRRRRKRKEYLIKWLGYPHSENSWVPETYVKKGGF